MAKPFYQTVTLAGLAEPCSLDHYIAPFDATMQVVVPAGTTATYTIEFTLDEINPDVNGRMISTGALPPVWTAFSGLPAAVNGVVTAAIPFPVRAVRINAATLAGGPLYFKVLQGFTIN